MHPPESYIVRVSSESLELHQKTSQEFELVGDALKCVERRLELPVGLGSELVPNVRLYESSMVAQTRTKLDSRGLGASLSGKSRSVDQRAVRSGVNLESRARGPFQVSSIGTPVDLPSVTAVRGRNRTGMWGRRGV